MTTSKTDSRAYAVLNAAIDSIGGPGNTPDRRVLHDAVVTRFKADSTFGAQDVPRFVREQRESRKATPVDREPVAESKPATKPTPITTSPTPTSTPFDEIKYRRAMRRLAIHEATLDDAEVEALRISLRHDVEHVPALDLSDQGAVNEWVSKQLPIIRKLLADNAESKALRTMVAEDAPGRFGPSQALAQMFGRK